MDTNTIGKRAALLSSIEIGLGSLLHAFSMPFAGHFLSLNQGFILVRASRESNDPRVGTLISTTAALLKSLSPAGKKLTPMLAIGMQGQLFGLGTLLLGTNPFGHILGMILLCLWGFVQPLLIYIVIYGRDLLGMTGHYLTELNKAFKVDEGDLILAIICVVVAKLVAGVVVVLFAHQASEVTVEKFQTWALEKKIPPPSKKDGNVYLMTLRDLVSPFFVISWVLMVMFFYHSQSDHSEFIWKCLRPVAIGYLIFLGLRLFPVEKLVQKLTKKNPELAETFGKALEHVRRL